MNLETGKRPWGMYEVLTDTSSHKVKRVTVNPRQRLSLQKHNQRSEHWIIIAGVADITLGPDTKRYQVAQSIDIPAGTIHRIANLGQENLVFIEVQWGTYFGEDDIIRLQDDYGRPE